MNDTPQSLKEGSVYASQFFHMHSQHDNMFLKQPEAATELFDSALENKGIKQVFRDTFLEYQAQIKKLKEVQTTLQEASVQKEFWEFQLDKMKTIDFEIEEYTKAKQAIAQSRFSLEKSATNSPSPEYILLETGGL